MTSPNVAPYLDSVGIKVLINDIDISDSVTDVDFNGEYKINDVTTFGYGVSVACPGGGSQWSPSIDISTFTLTVVYNQVTDVGIAPVFLSLGSGGAPTGVWNSRAKVPFVIGPAGDVPSSGNKIITGYCYAPKFNLIGKVGNAVTAKIDFKVDGGAIVSEPVLSSSYHTVTFNHNGGVGSMTPQVANTATALTLNTFTRTYFSFNKWNTAYGGSGTDYADGASYPFTADVTLFAQWTPLATHTVTFDANGGTGTMAPQTSDSPAALTTNTFTYSGYTFTGWNTEAGGGGTHYADEAIYAFSADVTLYAQWAGLPPSSHTVTFNSNGGTGSMTPQVASTPTALTTNSFTREGYTFEGWDTVQGGGGDHYDDGAIYGFSANVTLYAQWAAITLVSIVLTPTSYIIIPPTPYQQLITAVGYYSDGSYQDISKAIFDAGGYAYPSSPADQLVLQLGGGSGDMGLLYGLEACTGTLTATYEGITSQTVNITITTE